MGAVAAVRLDDCTRGWSAGPEVLKWSVVERVVEVVILGTWRTYFLRKKHSLKFCTFRVMA